MTKTHENKMIKIYHVQIINTSSVNVTSIHIKYLYLIFLSYKNGLRTIKPSDNAHNVLIN